jgi:hypothetical protein
MRHIHKNNIRPASSLQKKSPGSRETVSYKFLDFFLYFQVEKHDSWQGNRACKQHYKIRHSVRFFRGGDALGPVMNVAASSSRMTTSTI